MFSYVFTPVCKKVSLFIHIAFPILKSHQKRQILFENGCMCFIISIQDKRTRIMFLEQMRKVFSCLIVQPSWVIGFMALEPTNNIRLLFFHHCTIKALRKLDIQKESSRIHVFINKRREICAVLVLLFFLSPQHPQNPKPAMLKVCMWETA